MWEYKGGKGIWKRYVNDETGEDSYAEHQPRLVKSWCGEDGHYFVFSAENPRIVVCKECALERNYVVGFHQLKDGKLLPRKK